MVWMVAPAAARAPLKRRRQRLERLRFRDLDDRVRDALRGMLHRLPERQAPGSACAPVRDADGLIEAIRRAREQAEPLGSPLSFDAVQRAGDELVLVRAEAVSGSDPDALPRWGERPLARVRRLGPDRYALLPADGPIDADADSAAARRTEHRGSRGDRDPL